MKRLTSTHPRTLLALLVVIFSFAAGAWNTPILNNGGGNLYTKYTWTGNDFANNLNWSNPANWCGSYIDGACRGASTAPGSTDAVVFNGTCSHCDATIDTTTSVNSIMMTSDYTGTITQAAGANLTLVGSGGSAFTQYGGTYLGSSGTFTAGTSGAQRIYFAGGTFTGGSGAITICGGSSNDFAYFIGGNFTASSTTTTIKAGADFRGLTSFAHNGGLVNFTLPTAVSYSFSGTSAVFNNVTFQAASTANVSLNSTSLVMDGNLTLAGASISAVAFNTGTIELRQGSVTRTGAVFSGNVITKFTGTGLQTIDNSAATSNTYPSIWVAQTSVAGSLKFIGSTITITGFLTTGDMGTINLNSVTFTFAEANPQASAFDTQSYVTFPSLTLIGNCLRFTLGTVKVSGDVVSYMNGTGNTINGTGVLEVGGNFSLGAGANYFATNAVLRLNGTGNQVIDSTASTNPGLPSIEINKTSGTLSFNGTPVFYGDFKYVQGTVTVPTNATFGFGATTISTSVTSNGFVWNNVSFGRISASANNWTIVDTMTVAGNFTMANTDQQTRLAGVAINVAGNIICNAKAGGLTYNLVAGTGFVLNGTNQTLDFTASTASPSAKGACNLGTLTVQSSGTVVATGDFALATYTSTAATPPDFTATTMYLSPSNTTFSPSTTQFGNVVVDGITMTVTGTATVNGNLSFVTAITGRSVNGGSFDVYGNLSFSNVGHLGTTAIRLLGNTDTTITRSSTNILAGTITVQKGAGHKVTLLSNFALNSGQNMSIAGGQLDLGSTANILTFSGGGAPSFSNGATLKLDAGQLWVGGSQIFAGGYSGSVVP